MIKKNCLYERHKDGVRVVTLSDQAPPKPPKGFYGRSMADWITVRYVGSGRKGYLKADDLLDPALYAFQGHVNPKTIWESSPKRGAQGRTPDNVHTAAAEHDLRELQIKKLRDQCLNGPLYGLTASQNAKGALDQAIHMILAGV